MSIDNMKVFNEYIMSATIETFAQEVAKFNAASGGTIVLTADGFDGDFLMESMFSSLSAAQRRVDRYGTNSAVSSTALAEIQHNSVKVAGGFGPVLFEPGQMQWLQRSPAEAIEVISRNLAQDMLADQLNTAVMAGVAAIENQSAAKYDASAASPTAAVSYAAMNSAHALFGDRSMMLRASVMRGQTYHRLIGQNLGNSSQLFQAGNVTVVDILGKIVVVTDAPALYEAASPINFEKVLSLVPGALVVHDAGNLISNIETTNGKERIETTFQADYDFGLGLKGYAWNTSVKSPTNAELATGSNWTKIATSIKDTAGTLTIGNADL